MCVCVCVCVCAVEWQRSYRALKPFTRAAINIFNLSENLCYASSS